VPFQCYFLGGGHATDNIVVWLPTENILFGGCMLKDNQATSIGNISDADVTAWPKTLDKVKAKFPSARYVVPGHGDYGGTELIEHTKQIDREPIYRKHLKAIARIVGIYPVFHERRGENFYPVHRM